MTAASRCRRRAMRVQGAETGAHTMLGSSLASDALGLRLSASEEASVGIADARATAFSCFRC